MLLFICPPPVLTLESFFLCIQKRGLPHHCLLWVFTVTCKLSFAVPPPLPVTSGGEKGIFSRKSQFALLIMFHHVRKEKQNKKAYKKKNGENYKNQKENEVTNWWSWKAICPLSLSAFFPFLCVSSRYLFFLAVVFPWYIYLYFYGHVSLNLTSWSDAIDHYYKPFINQLKANFKVVSPLSQIEPRAVDGESTHKPSSVPKASSSIASFAAADVGKAHFFPDFFFHLFELCAALLFLLVWKSSLAPVVDRVKGECCREISNRMLRLYYMHIVHFPSIK